MQVVNIACLLYHKVNELEFMSIYSTLRKSGNPEHLKLNTYTLAKSRNAVETENDIIISPHWGFMSAPEPDVMIIVGGDTSFASNDKVIISYLKTKLKQLKYIISLSEGVYLLNKLGIPTNLELGNSTDFKSHLESTSLLKSEGGVWCASGEDIGIRVATELFVSLHNHFLK